MSKAHILIVLCIIAAAVILFYQNTEKTMETTTINKQIPETAKYSAQVISICAEENNIECSECLDGFNEYCYFNSLKYNRSDFGVGIHSMPDEDRNKCIGIHSYSICGECQNNFELWIGETLQMVSCEDFFTAIEIANEECTNCVDTIVQGCC